MIFMRNIFLIIGLCCAIGHSTCEIESSDKTTIEELESIIDTKNDLEIKNPSKRETTDGAGQKQSVAASSSIVSSNFAENLDNFQPIYGSNYDTIGQYFAAAASPQIYYVKAPQSGAIGTVNGGSGVAAGAGGGGGGGSSGGAGAVSSSGGNAGVAFQYAAAVPNAGIKFAFTPVAGISANGIGGGNVVNQSPPAIAIAPLPSNGKVGYSAQIPYPQYQIAFGNQPFSYGPALAVPYGPPQQHPFNSYPVTGSYQVAPLSGTTASPILHTQQQHHHSSPTPITSYVTVPPTSGSKVSPTPSTGYYSPINNQIFHQSSYTFPSFIPPSFSQAPNAQKLIAVPVAQYKPHAHNQQPPQPTPAGHSTETATSYAHFSQQINHQHQHQHQPSPTVLTPVKVLPQPHTLYATSAPVYQQKLPYGSYAASASAPHPYVAGGNNGAIHYGTQLFHPNLPKFVAFGPVAPPLPQKFIYPH